MGLFDFLFKKKSKDAEPALGVTSEMCAAPKAKKHPSQLELLEVEEVRLRDGWGRDGKRGSHRYEYIPLALLDEVVLACPEDYAEHFLPQEEALPSPFTAAQYARATGLRGKAAYALLHILTDLGFLSPADKIGRAGAWKRV